MHQEITNFMQFRLEKDGSRVAIYYYGNVTEKGFALMMEMLELQRDCFPKTVDETTTTDTRSETSQHNAEDSISP